MSFHFELEFIFENVPHLVTYPIPDLVHLPSIGDEVNVTLTTNCLVGLPANHRAAAFETLDICGVVDSRKFYHQSAYGDRCKPDVGWSIRVRVTEYCDAS